MLSVKKIVLLSYPYFMVVLIASAEVSSYRPHHPDDEKHPPIPILRQSYNQHHDGYDFGYDTGNGIHAEEAGYIKNKGDEKNEFFVQKGTVTYHDEHGNPITLTYIADEHGFRAEGAHLPTPPPLPPYVQKMLHEQEYDDNQNTAETEKYFN